MTRSRALWMKCAVVVLVCGMAALLCCGGAQASPRPPASGDWIIEADEEVTITGETILLPGNLIVYGKLTLDGSSLTFAGPGNLMVYGTFVSTTGSKVTSAPDGTGGGQFWGMFTTASIVATGTTFASSTPYYAVFGAYDSTNRLVGCTFNKVEGVFVGSSVNTMENVTWNGISGSYAWVGFQNSSRNTLTDVDFNDIAFFTGNESQTHATRCLFSVGYSGVWGAVGQVNEFVDCDAPYGFSFYWFGANTWTGGSIGYIQIETGSNPPYYTLRFSHVRPGYQQETIIGSTPDLFRLELRDVTTAYYTFNVSAYTGASLEIADSDIYSLGCSGSVKASITDNSYVNALRVYTIPEVAWAETEPMNLTVSGSTDNVGPMTATATSDTGNFSLQIVDSAVGRSEWYLGDNGDPALPSHSEIKDSYLSYVGLNDTSTLSMSNSSVWNAMVVRNDSQLTADSSTFSQLILSGRTSHAALNASTVNWWLEFAPESGTTSSPTLEMSDAVLPDWYSAERLVVGENVMGARILGTAQIYQYRAVEWAPGSTINRSFPVLVTRIDGTPLSGAQVSVFDASGAQVWSGVTGTDGTANPDILFTDANHGSAFRVVASAVGGQTEAPLGFLSSTPIALVIPITYQTRWLPPIKSLEEGYSYTMPDGSTLPIKLSLTVAGGGFVDEPGLSIVVTDDSGNVAISFPRSELQIEVGENGQQYYLVKLRTRETGMQVGPTYYIKALVAGRVVGSVVDLVLRSGGVAKGK